MIIHPLAEDAHLFDATYKAISYESQRFHSFIWSTPPNINIEPENDGLEDDFPFPGVYSQVPC